MLTAATLPASTTATTNNCHDDCECRPVEMEQGGDDPTGQEQVNTRRQEVTPAI